MSKVFLISSLIIGTIIGAGFASGREIVSFFGQTPSIFVAPTVAVLTFVFVIVYLFAGKKAQATTLDEYHKTIFGKGQIFLSVVTLTNCIITMSAMLAGMDALFSAYVPLKPLFSVIFAIFSTLIVISGKKGLLNASGIIVPLLVAVTIIISSNAIDQPQIELSISVQSMVNSVLYTALNSMLSASVIVTIGDLSTRQIIISSLISAIIMGLLTLLITLALCSTSVAQSEMPMIEMASYNPVLLAVAIFSVACAIFTTLIASHSALSQWVNEFSKSRVFSAVITAIASLSLSFIGFKEIVDTLYLGLGVIGVGYAVVNAVYLFRKRSIDEEVYPRTLLRHT